MANLVDEGLDTIDAAGWHPADVVAVRDGVLFVDCLCGCGWSTAAAGMSPVWDARLGEYFAWAINNAPSLVAWIKTAEERIAELEDAHAQVLARGRALFEPVRDEHLAIIVTEGPAVIARRLHTSNAVAKLLRWFASNAAEVLADHLEADPIEIMKPVVTQARVTMSDQTPAPTVTTAEHTVSCVPFGHPNRRHLEIKVRQRRDGRWNVSDGFEFYDPSGQPSDEPWPMDEAEGLELAKRLAPAMTVEGCTVADELGLWGGQ
ncbi:hypothetical protein [Nocardia sp. NPDC046763]|uniref:hypothetical protein n=1 Tax=Nocardia sp. NPDC046763 TaxID=3155256 RepID=UPI0033C4E422